MVTLQILVLSFLVRIQVAQQKKENNTMLFSFFCWALGVGKSIAILTINQCRAFVIDASIRQCPTLITATLHLLPPSQPVMIYFFGYLILTARWLSRYEGGLLLGQKPCAFL